MPHKFFKIGMSKNIILILSFYFLTSKYAKNRIVEGIKRLTLQNMNIQNKIEWTKKHMPVMEMIRKDFFKSQPFKDILVGACLHITKETAILLTAIQDGGAAVIACASNPFSTQDDVAEYLRDRDIQVWGRKGMTEEEYKEGLWAVVNRSPHYVIDDGADLTILIHEMNVAPPLGGLEETTTGVTRIKNMDLKYPIIAVNDAQTKHFFDNVYGTGQSTIDGIIRSTNVLLAGKTFVVAGYGYCGRGLAQRAKGMGCNVIVTEIDPVKALQATMDGFKVMRMDMAVFEADIVVTVTGSINVLDENIRDLKDGAIIANAGHFDVEINKKVLERAEKITIISKDITEYKMWEFQTIYLLSEGRLVNLVAAEGHPSEVMDMSFANQAMGLKYLIENNLEKGVHDIPESVDKQVAIWKLQTLGIEIDKETPEQIKYRQS